MLKRHNTDATRNIEKKSSSYSENASAFPASRSNHLTPDEIILSLSNAYENQRARQVTEWERVQAMRLKRAA